MAVFCSLILKCYNLNVIRLDGISVTPLQMKRLVDNLPSLYNVSIDIRQLANFKRIKEYLQSGQNLQHLSISIPLTCRCSTSVIEEIWKNQGYRPLEVSLCSSLVWRTGSGVHHNIISAPEQAVFRVFLRKKAPLDLFDEAPVCEFPYRAHSNYQLSSQVVTCLGSKTLPVTAPRTCATYIYIHVHDFMCDFMYVCTVGVKKKCPYFSVVQGSTRYCGWFIRLLH